MKWSSLNRIVEKRSLQALIMIGCLVPLAGGLEGIIYGARLSGHVIDITINSHVRYLSGLLLGIACGFASAIPAIEKNGKRVGLLVALVVTGGLARLYSVLVEGWPEPVMIFGLVMELGVVPILWLWQRRMPGPVLFVAPALSLCRLTARMSARSVRPRQRAFTRKHTLDPFACGDDSARSWPCRCWLPLSLGQSILVVEYGPGGMACGRRRQVVDLRG